jgi:hypothetical protein
MLLRPLSLTCRFYGERQRNRWLLSGGHERAFVLTGGEMSHVHMRRLTPGRLKMLPAGIANSLPTSPFRKASPTSWYPPLPGPGCGHILSPQNFVHAWPKSDAHPESAIANPRIMRPSKALETSLFMPIAPGGLVQGAWIPFSLAGIDLQCISIVITFSLHLTSTTPEKPGHGSKLHTVSSRLFHFLV